MPVPTRHRLLPVTALVLLVSGCGTVTDAQIADRLDQDGDGYDAIELGGTDCDDDDATVHPGAVDLPYDGVDAACDGDLGEWDVDGDGYDVDADCDDTRPDVFPGAPDAWYDGVDSDCDGADDCDRDRDGYPIVGVSACTADLLLPPYDCDDTNGAINPGAYDAWYDGVDSNCDGADDCDQDGDGYAAENAACGGEDCDDTNPRRYPGAPDGLLGGILTHNDCAFL
ncbi:MAG: MopE-related protein [Myxococcota bacterium]